MCTCTQVEIRDTRQWGWPDHTKSGPSSSQPAIIALLFFLQFKEFELYWGAVFFTTRRGVLEKSFLLINFIGVTFEAGNETREKIWSDLVAEQK